MTDDLDHLKSALQAATPAPSDKARMAARDAALAEFSKLHQGSASGDRPIKNRTIGAGFLTGVKAMIDFATRPATLKATTALASLVIVTLVGVQVTRQPQPVYEAQPVLLEEDLEARSSAITRKRLQAKVPAEQAISAAPMQEAQVADTLGADALSDRAVLGLAPAEAPALQPVPEASTETFAHKPENRLYTTLEDPVSTFSIDVDTASYAYVRNALVNGHLPDPASVRAEEMINYFDYAYPKPTSVETPFTTSVSVAPTPWNPDTRLMHIGIQGYDLPLAERPALNLVFLIDTSGSMQDANKLPLLIRAFSLLLDTLGEQDSVAIVTYAGSAGLALEPTSAGERSKIITALQSLSAGGSTAGQRGLQQAYAVAKTMSAVGEVSRVILATDGDFNVGIADPDALKTYIEDQRDSGIYLSALGFGRGNYQDAALQALAQNGNGTAAYIDTLAEARKVLVDEVAGALFPIANDVKIQVEFNPAEIAEYRLIGYETRALRREDFNNDAVDAGEIGAGHRVTAIYELTPKGSAAQQVDPLRYGAARSELTTGNTGEYAFLKLRYKRPGEAQSRLITTPVQPDRADIDPQETAFAAAVAGFAERLGGRDLPGDWSYDEILSLAAKARGEDPFGYRSEFMTLVRQARAVAEH